MEFECRSLPSTRYYGSKRQHASWIIPILCRLDANSYLDAFGGTASISLALCAQQKRVIYNDLYKFNQSAACALLQARMPKAKLQRIVQKLQGISHFKRGLVSEHLNGFFTESENQWLDTALEIAHDRAEEDEKHVLLYLISQACLRKRPFNLFHRNNLHLRLNDIPRKFGNAVTWARSFPEHIEQLAPELLKAWAIRKSNAEVLAAGPAYSINRRVDAVYIDPPYFRSDNKQENYERRYHFLELIQDYPAYRAGKQLPPPFSCSLKNRETQTIAQLTKTIQKLARTCARKAIAVSYEESSTDDHLKIANTVSELFSEVYVHKRKTRRRMSKTDSTELLIIGVNQ